VFELKSSLATDGEPSHSAALAQWVGSSDAVAWPAQVAPWYFGMLLHLMAADPGYPWCFDVVQQ